VTRLLLIANVLVYAVGSYPYFVETRVAFGKRWAFYAPDIFEGHGGGRSATCSYTRALCTY